MGRRGQGLPADPDHAGEHEPGTRVLLLGYGAELVLTPASPKACPAPCAEPSRSSPRRPNAWMPQQFENPANPEIHRRTTAVELWEDTDGKIDILVAALAPAARSPVPARC